MPDATAPSTIKIVTTITIGTDKPLVYESTFTNPEKDTDPDGDECNTVIKGHIKMLKGQLVK
jgi:hypothetical protein